METGLALMLPGLLGGLVLAAVLARLNRTPSSKLSRRSELEPISPDVINMAHIRVAGVLATPCSTLAIPNASR